MTMTMLMLSLIMGFMITLSAKSWMMAWLGLELNLLSFITMLVLSTNLQTASASIKYFLIQAPASLVILESSILPELSSFITVTILLALSMKLGMFPFYFWFPQVASDLSWDMNMVLMTLQKIAPLSLIMNLLTHQPIVFTLIVILSSLISSVLGFNELYTRKIMAYSSINHLSWMMISMMNTPTFWFLYLLLYSVLAIITMKLMYKHNMNHINQTNLNQMHLFTILMALMSLGGLPPLLGFLPKLMVVYSLSESDPMIITLLLTTSLMTLYFYTRTGFMASMKMATSPMNIFAPSFFTMETALILLNLSGIILFGIFWNFT